MHPKAAQLALAGFALCEHAFHDDSEWRIKRQKENRESQLSINRTIYPGLRAQWDITTSTALTSYQERPWSDLPDDVLDQLPQELINQFIQEN